MSRQCFIEDVADALKEKVDMVKGSMDLSPEMLPTFMLGMSCATDAILKLTDGSAISTAAYRIYPVEYIAIPDKEPIPYYARDRDFRDRGTNDLVKEIWEKVSS